MASYRLLVTTFSALLCACLTPLAQSPLPEGKLVFGDFEAFFNADGTFQIGAEGWPSFAGEYVLSSFQLTLDSTQAPQGCEGQATYSFKVEGGKLLLQAVQDDCKWRSMFLDGSAWRPHDMPVVHPPRALKREFAEEAPPLPAADPDPEAWASFRGPGASGVADDQNLPVEWDLSNGKNVLWKRPVPGLAHSSPIVWGDRVFVATAISSRGDASFRPGLYGDGDASTDRSEHRWMLYAFDRESGEIVWQLTAYEGAPREKRHIKSTYASSTPASDGRIVVAFFGSQGVFAYDVAGNLRWSVDLGKLNAGAYNAPNIEWGTASSPVIWDGKVILQVDTHEDSFVIALDIETGQTIWKTERDELPSWGTPNVIEASTGPELVTNASNFIRGYDPRTGEELWRLGGSSKITAPTPFLADGLIVVASGRSPEKPIFAIRPGARGDISLSAGETSHRWIAWSRQRRGPYMPTPVAYRGVLYVLANNGIFDAYDLASGEEIYRARVPHLGSGFSASPIASDGRIFLSSEDGDIIIVRAGTSEFEHIATQPMGELLMATPAVSRGVLFVRTVNSLVAIKDTVGKPGSEGDQDR